jgi:hypothetical protein
MSATRRQVTQGVKGAASKATETAQQVKQTGEEAAATAIPSTETASPEGLLERTEFGKGSSNEQTIRQELAAIVREAAIEVLAPIARQVTTYAAKYAVKQGPTLAQKTLMPRIQNTLDSVAEAGGAGAFAKDALSSVSGSGGGVLSRLGAGDLEENGRHAWQEAKAPIEEHVDVAIPLQDAYEHFQQFGQHISFMSDREQVDEVPNERIVWESADGIEAICVITFHELSYHLTRVMVTYEPHPHGLQKATSALRSPRRMLRNDLLHFKSLVEVHPDEVDALYEEPEEPEAEAGLEPDEDDESAEDEEPEDEEPEDEEPEVPKARPRGRSGSARSRAETRGGQASAGPRKRTLRGGSEASSSAGGGSRSSAGGGRRQAQPASKPRQRTRAKG